MTNTNVEKASHFFLIFGLFKSPTDFCDVSTSLKCLIQLPAVAMFLKLLKFITSVEKPHGWADKIQFVDCLSSLSGSRKDNYC